MTPHDALDRGLDELALALPKGAREKLLAYTELLAKWNRTYNLTAIRDPLDMVTLHLLDSLVVIPHLPAAATLVDVGSGGGLPGIPLAIAFPACRVTLNEASGKKAAFLRQAAIELALNNVLVHEGRAQAWQPADRFAVVISRAFSGLAEFIATARHLVARDGVLAAMKGAAPTEELAKVPSDCACNSVISLKVPFVRAERHLVLCKVSA